jgi:site-specific recombinase XerD
LAQTTLDHLPCTDARILPYNPDSASTAIYRARKMTGIDNLHLHGPRHEGISRLFTAGLSIQHVAMISGHLSWTTLKRYTHLTTKDVLGQFRPVP